MSASANDDAAGPLRETCLADLHRSLGARMVPFAGWSMPVQYADGIMTEHKQTRTAAGLFDVSHMGQARLVGPSYAAVAAALEAVAPGDFANLKPGRMQYSVLLTRDGTIIDDLMVTRPQDPNSPRLLMVFNAARVAEDEAAVRAALPPLVSLEMPDGLAMLALQGPKAVDALSRHADVAGMVFMDAIETTIDGVPAYVSRSGYTGEDGYEIVLPAAQADAVARALLAEPEVRAIGLGARDSLRLEAGLPLYGHDIDQTTTPIEAGLGFAVAPRRRQEGGFPGATRILDDIADGTWRRRVGLLVEGRMPAREGAVIQTLEGEAIGRVTSGGFAPTMDRPIAMGYVVADHGEPGTLLNIEVRGKLLRAEVVRLPFVPHRYQRRRVGEGARP